MPWPWWITAAARHMKTVAFTSLAVSDPLAKKTTEDESNAKGTETNKAVCQVSYHPATASQLRHINQTTASMMRSPCT